MKRTRLLISLLAVFLLLPLALSSCTKGDTPDAQDLCTEMVEAALDNDFDAAFALCDETCTKNDFLPIWRELRKSLASTESYELKHVGWHVRKESGTPIYTSDTFELTTDDGKTCYLEIRTTSDVDGIAGMYFLDSTEFLEKTAFIPWLNVLPILSSLACIAFCIWMLVDCAKRRIKTKIGWIILIFAGVSFTLVIGAEGLDFDFNIGLFLAFSYISRDAASLAVSIRGMLPVGAILYCCLRKRITLPDPPATEAPTAEQPTPSNTPEAAATPEASEQEQKNTTE